MFRSCSLLFLAFSISTLLYAQQKNYKPTIIPLDSVEIITPITDVSGDFSNRSEASVNEIKLFVINHLKDKLNKTTYTSIPTLENISPKEYANITHNYLAWASKYYHPSLWKSPEIAITDKHKYSLLISINGYYESITQNSVYVNFTIINNYTKRIMYTQIKKNLDNSIATNNRILTMIDQLIENYK